jgi:hypothetical protein
MTDDIKTARQVVKDLFSKTGNMIPNPARTKDDMAARLFLAHTLINSILMGNTGKGGLAERWGKQIEDIEARINDLCNSFHHPKHGPAVK